jgi:PIN domain nuclease of toxin-antitoxin system
VILLDTHVWLWSAEGDTRRVGRRTQQLLARAGSGDVTRVSPVTLFEVAALHALGRVRLACPPEQWIREALAGSGARIAELTPTIAVDAGQIGRTALADPLDRLLVATARQLGAVFVTADARILAYASTTAALRVHNAST